MDEAAVSGSEIAAGPVAARRKSEDVAFWAGFGSMDFVERAGFAGVVWPWTRTSSGRSVSSTTGSRCLWCFAFGLAAGGAVFFLGCFFAAISEGVWTGVL